MPASKPNGGRVAVAGVTDRVSPELQHEIEQFLYFEAELLDERRFADWYDLLADDLHYWMPTRTNRLTREIDLELAGPKGLAHFDETKESIGWRIRQLESGTHWAEDPPSRTRHLVSNVRIRPDGDDVFAVRSNFLCYRNRREAEVDLWAGERRDVLRRAAGGFSIASRTIVLDQDVILSKNLSVFL